jgi:NTP pyrophosphatase (non-canonical NTP hydrolase)
MDLRRLSDDVETISQRYAEVHSFRRDDAWFLLKLQEEVGELTQAFLMRSGQARAKGLSPEQLEANFGAEFADVLCQLLLMARNHDIDLEAEVERKWLYRLRPS